MMTSDQKIPTLPVAFYLNQKVVFDMMAIIEDGFSVVQQVTTATSTEETKEKGNTYGLGASNVFSFVRFGFDRNTKKQDAAKEAIQSTSEKIHTPASILSKLMEYLEERKEIIEVNSSADLASLKSGSFVRFRGLLSEPPLTHLLKSFKKIMPLVLTFSDEGGKKNSEYKNTGAQIDALLNAVGNSEITDLLCAVPQSDSTAVLTVSPNYFSGNSIHEVNAAECVVFGKTLRVLPKDSSDSIDLLRNSSLSIMQEQLIETMLNSLAENKDQFNLPEIVTKIEGPSLLVFPIAIYG